MKRSLLYWFSILLTALAVVNWQGCSDDNGQDDDNPQTTVLFAEAYDSSGAIPAAEVMTFVTQEGGLMKAEVYAGQVIIHSSNATATQMHELVVKNGGRIVAQIPGAGNYLAVTDKTKMSLFLNVLYDSPLVEMAFPNRPCVPKRPGTGVNAGSSGLSAKTTLSVNALSGDAGSIVQTIDVESSIGCDPLTHLGAVAAVAGKSGVDVHTNALEVDAEGNADYEGPFTKVVELIEYAYLHKKPVVINISMGGRDEVAGESEDFYLYMCHTLEEISTNVPGILDYAVVMIACTNNHVDETQTITGLVNRDPGADLWNHLYFVGGQSGAAGCTGGGGTGYAASGTTSYLAAPSCDQPIPNSQCAVSGNSFAVPQVAGTVARTYELMKQEGQEMSVSEITAKLWEYQTLYSGQVPTPEQLRDYIKGIVPQALYDGTWHGTFKYTASVPQEEGPDLIVNTSFTIDFTLKSELSLPGYPHMLRFQAITCSDQRFGATMAVVPDQQLSMALLPGAYASEGEQGMGFVIEFPNGSTIMTNNNDAGCFTVNPAGTLIASTALVEDDAFLAGTNIGDSNNPLSGPGQYAYNWCTFRNWKMERVMY